MYIVDSLEFNLKRDSTSRCAEIKTKNKNYQEKVKEKEVLQEKVKRLAVFLKYLLEFNHMESLTVLISKEEKQLFCQGTEGVLCPL